MGLWLPHCALLVVQSGWPKEVTNSLVGASVPRGLGTACAADPAGSRECLVHGPHSVSQAQPVQQHRVGQDTRTLPQPSCRQLYFQPHAHVTHVSSPSPASSQGYCLRLGWSLCFCTDQCKWMLADFRAGVPLPLPACTGHRHPCTYTACMIIHRSKLQTHPYLTSINAAPAALCSKPWGDQPCPVAALCLPKM